MKKSPSLRGVTVLGNVPVSLCHTELCEVLTGIRGINFDWASGRRQGLLAVQYRAQNIA
jgi:hypothetical protein